MPRHVVHLIKRVSQNPPSPSMFEEYSSKYKDTVVSIIRAAITAITVTRHYMCLT